MNTPGFKSLLLKVTGIAILVAAFCLGNTFYTHAQQPDTSGVVFTEITTATDSLANATKDTQQVVKSASATVAPVAATQAPKTLWTIFIAGFLGGFAAFLMPCIYPMLPLTVSFFYKKRREPQ